jgi:hypothetical protein
MNDKSHTIRRTLQAAVLAALVAAVAVPSAFAGNSGSPGIVPSKLGSPDPRESNGNVNSAGLVPSTLGSQDPRDTASEAAGSQSSIVARQLGSQDPRDTASQIVAESSMVASELGTPDTRDAALQANDGDFMFRDYFRGTHYGPRVGQASIVARQLGSPDARDAGLQWNDGDFMFRDYFNGTHYVVRGHLEEQTSADDGIDWNTIGIGIVGAVCGLLLLTALGIGARQVRHTRHRLGSA